MTDDLIGDFPKSKVPEAIVGNSVGMKMIFIQAGQFDMGTRERVEEILHFFPDIPACANPQRWLAYEMPLHRVSISKPFYLGKYPVTVSQFEVFVQATGYRTDAEIGGGAYRWTGNGTEFDPKLNWRNPGIPQGHDHPVVCVTRKDANVFCMWLSETESETYRLPTDAEWEYACRAGTTTYWSFGNDRSLLGEYAWYSENSGGSTHPVGRKKPNPWGLYDMHGNVAMYVADSFEEDYYRKSPPSDPTGPVSDGSRAIIRGAAWLDEAWDLRSADRRWVPADHRVHDHGFRVARTVRVE